MSKFILRRKNFSLEEGRYTGKKSSALKTVIGQAGTLGTIGAAWGGVTSNSFKGAGIGLAVGTILGLITSALTRSKFNKKPTLNITTDNLISEFGKLLKESEASNRTAGYELFKTTIPGVDEDPTKFDMSVKSNEDSAVLFVRKLNKLEIDVMNGILDAYCYVKRANDYTAEQQKDGSWIITLKMINCREVAEFLLDVMSELRFSINFLTK